MSNALASLQALANQQYKPRNTPKSIQSKRIAEVKLIEIDTDTKEVRVTFQGELTKHHEDRLFSEGFKWQIGSNIWIADYTNAVINYLNKCWNQSIDLIPLDNLPLGMTIEHVSAEETELIVVPDREETMIDRYRRQVDELCESLKIDRADLLLLAIDHLYNSKLAN